MYRALWGNIRHAIHKRKIHCCTDRKQILALFCYRGTCDTVLFNMWVKGFLLPELKPGQVVIMDNAAFHKSQETKKLIETAGCQVLFLSSYSRDLDPIEQVWVSIKRRCKQCWKK